MRAAFSGGSAICSAWSATAKAATGRTASAALDGGRAYERARAEGRDDPAQLLDGCGPAAGGLGRCPCDRPACLGDIPMSLLRVLFKRAVIWIGLGYLFTLIEFCRDCGIEQPVVWSASDELWAEVMGVRQSPLCPACFDLRLQILGIGVRWVPQVEYRFDSEHRRALAYRYPNRRPVKA